MFGRDDAFLDTLIKLLRRLPVYPMFGSGGTKLQPAVWKMWAKLSQGCFRGQKRRLTVECGRSRASLV